MRAKEFAVTMVLTLCAACASWAQPASMTDIYDGSTLSFWQDRYRNSMQKILDQGFKPVLTSSEIAALRGLELEVPRSSEDPFDFWSRADQKKISMPASGLNFLSDITVAYTWLRNQGYSEETIEDYIVMLRYKAPSAWIGGRPPPPLRALGVPDVAVEDQRALRLFNSMRAFILAHEMGHVFHGHPCSTISAENEADKFALDLMARSGTIPAGAVLFFTLSTLWMQEPGERAETSSQCGKGKSHPISAERLYTIAREMDTRAASFGQNDPTLVKSIAVLIRQLAREHFDTSLPDTVQMQQCIVNTAIHAGPSILSPRPRGAPSPLRCSVPQSPAAHNISGRWRDNLGTVYQVNQKGNQFTFTAEGNWVSPPVGSLCRGSFRSRGQGTIAGDVATSVYSSTTGATGTCSTTISNSRMNCIDTMCGSFSVYLSQQ
jgi:hypothetical protein